MLVLVGKRSSFDITTIQIWTDPKGCHMSMSTHVIRHIIPVLKYLHCNVKFCHDNDSCDARNKAGLRNQD